MMSKSHERSQNWSRNPASYSDSHASMIIRISCYIFSLSLYLSHPIPTHLLHFARRRFIIQFPLFALSPSLSSLAFIVVAFLTFNTKQDVRLCTDLVHLPLITNRLALFLLLGRL
jgi:hypothetical protein